MLKGVYDHIIFMFSLFQTKEHQILLKPNTSFDPRVVPQPLFHQLAKKSEQKACIKLLTTPTKNGFKIMRRLCFCHILIMHSNKFYNIAEAFINTNMLSADQWLNENTIKPYYRFLKKILNSLEMYISCKEPFNRFSFDKQFYINNLLTEMVRIVAKMPLIGRYYKEKNQEGTISYICTVAVQAQKLYLPWKNGLQQLLNNPKQYLQNRSDQKLVKALIQECMPFLNEEMKKLFLDKYFYPYGKGIGIKLFRIQQQPEVTAKLINGILRDHKETERKMAQKQLQDTLFPGQGKFNFKFFEQSLIQDHFIQEEVCLSDEQVQPVIFENTTIKEKDQKETSDHMEYCEQV